jgi:hypothetical protein
MGKVKLMYKKPFEKSEQGLCLNCGREAPPCECGFPTSRECSIHSEPMRVLAIPVYMTANGGADREIIGWVNVAECPRLGCGNVRSLKFGQGVDRNQNRKRGKL